ncbi:alpha/beta fold hydrolase [Myxococcota bacterium]|nr:alpha/beta fold hydrolase [Myxococcota bacterium]
MRVPVVEERDVPVAGGVRLSCHLAGSGPPTVLLHGFPESWRSFDLQIPPLSSRLHLAVPDLRGYGGSDKPAGGYDLDTLADDVHGLIRALWPGRAARVVGHDWGGAIAFALAARHPDVVDRLAILNAPHPALFARRVFTTRQLLRSWYMFAFQVPLLPEALLRAGDGAALARMVRAAAARPDALPESDVRRTVEGMLEPGVLESGLAYYRAALRHPLRALSYDRAIEAPTLVLWGEKDPALGVDLLRGLERWVPRLRVHRVPGAGHWVQREAADEVNRALLEWLVPDPAPTTPPPPP